MVATALTHLLPGQGERILTPDEQAQVDAVLDAAAMEHPDADTTGSLLWDGKPSPAYTRFVAVRVTPKSDPRRAALLTLINRLITESGYVRTEQGVFTPEDLGEHDVALHWRRTSDQPDPWRTA